MEYRAVVNTSGSIKKNKFIHLSSWKTKFNILGNINSIDDGMDTKNIDTINDDVKYSLSVSILLRQVFSATFREIVVGIPEAAIAISREMIEIVIWYNPIPSAPKTLDKYILKTKEINLVSAEIIVTIENALIVLFIL